MLQNKRFSKFDLEEISLFSCFYKIQLNLTMDTFEFATYWTLPTIYSKSSKILNYINISIHMTI